MTVNQILTQAMMELDEDIGDLPEYEQRFMRYLNAGYRIAMRRYFRPHEQHAAHTDRDGFACRPMGMLRVVAVRDENGRDVAFRESVDGSGMLKTSAHDADVYIAGEMEECPLKGSVDEPQLPEHAHDALVDYICYRHLSSGNLAKQARAQYYLQSFYDAMSAIRPQGDGAVTNYTNLYAATDL